jgi:RNA polymerase sigma-70 factor (ECF subfamily)
MGDVFTDRVVGLIPDLRAYASALTRSRAEADDLVQDTLMRAWRSRDRFAAGTNMKAWLFQILRNVFYTDLGKRRRLVQDVDGFHASQLSVGPEQLWRAEYDDLVRAMDALTLDARDALVLVLASGLSYEEAAEVCGCPVGTMKSRVNRARERVVELVDMAPAPVAHAQPVFA